MKIQDVKTPEELKDFLIENKARITRHIQNGIFRSSSDLACLLWQQAHNLDASHRLVRYIILSVFDKADFAHENN